MRPAGCIINDICDRRFDQFVERTKTRPLASGQITLKGALVLLFILLGSAFGLVLFLNPFTIFLAVIGVLITAIYPLLKRVTHLPQVGIGVAFSWGIPMAFAAQQNHVPFEAWCLFGSAILWPIIYDTMYAMSDRIDDLKIGVKSTALLFGKYDRLVIGALQVIFLGLMLCVGFLFSLKSIYYMSLGLVILLFLHEQRMIKDRDRRQCFQAFLHNHWVGAVIFLGILLG
jgi:4-hydroxybenzoate polyprenyltransferase